MKVTKKGVLLTPFYLNMISNVNFVYNFSYLQL